MIARGDFRYRDLEQQQTARNHQLLGCCDEPAGKPPAASAAAPPSGGQSRCWHMIRRNLPCRRPPLGKRIRISQIQLGSHQLRAVSGFLPQPVL